MSRHLLAPLSIVTAMMLLALGDNFVEDVAPEMSVWQYHAMRAALLLPVMAALIRIFGGGAGVWPRRPVMVLTRSSFSITALLLYFSAIPAVGIATAAAGLFTSPIFVVLISVAIFRERVGLRRWVAVAAGFAGVCLVLKVGSEPLRPMAVAPLLGGMFYALSVIWVRRHCQQEVAPVLAFWNMAVFVLAGSAGMLLTPWLAAAIGDVEGAGFLTRPLATPSTGALGLIVLMGVLAAAGMSLLAWGYRSVDSTFAALFDYSFLFWAPLFAWIVRGQTVDAAMVAGMALIVTAGALAVTGLRRQATT